MSSPQEFYYACKGYFDKEEDHSRLVRLQTHCIVTGFGAKLRSGADIKVTDLWELSSDADIEISAPSWAASSLQLRKEILEKQRKANAKS